MILAVRMVGCLPRFKLYIELKYVGELELFIDGRSTILAEGLTFRKGIDSHVQGMHFQTFFGGKRPSLSSEHDMT